MSAAILLIAHGSRRQAANDELQKVAEILRIRLPLQIIEAAYLELAQPDIPTGLTNCVQHQVDTIWMLPYFLSPGSHVTDDLHRFRNEFVEAHPHVQCTVCPPLGLHPLIQEVLLDRLKEAGYPE